MKNPISSSRYYKSAHHKSLRVTYKNLIKVNKYSNKKSNLFIYLLKMSIKELDENVKTTFTKRQFAINNVEVFYIILKSTLS